MDASARDVTEIVPPDGRVVVFRALAGLGDFLCVVPALRALKTARPDVELTWIGLPDSAPLARRFDRYVDRFLPFPGFPGLPDRRPDVRRLPGFLASVQAWEFDLAIQLQGNGDLTNLVTALFRARRMAGHYLHAAPPADSSLFLPWVEGCSEVRRSLRLMAHLGWASDDESLEFPVAATADAELDAIDGLDGLAARRIVCLHPGATDPRRRWSPAGFAEVGDRLAERGYAIVLTGSASERDLTGLVARLMRQPALDLAGRTSADALAALYRRSALLVCNDTGVSHLAAALRVPSVVVFRTSDKRRWAPLDHELHRPVFGSARQVLAEASRALRMAQRRAA